nr:MAG TPA: hypothetical protein [Bacteriophage sp.]
MPVLSLLMYLIRRGGSQEQLALCGVLWQTSTAEI